MLKLKKINSDSGVIPKAPRLDNAFVISMVSQFMQSLGTKYFNDVNRISRCMKRNPERGMF